MGRGVFGVWDLLAWCNEGKISACIPRDVSLPSDVGSSFLCPPARLLSSLFAVFACLCVFGGLHFFMTVSAPAWPVMCLFHHKGLYIHHVCYWLNCIAAAAKSLQSCPTLCDPTDGSPPGSAVPGILQARILEWVSICIDPHPQIET